MSDMVRLCEDPNSILDIDTRPIVVDAATVAMQSCA